MIHITSWQEGRSVLAVLVAGPFYLMLTTEDAVLKILLLFRNLYRDGILERPF